MSVLVVIISATLPYLSCLLRPMIGLNIPYLAVSLASSQQQLTCGHRVLETHFKLHSSLHSPKWQLQSICLCTLYVVEDYTGENLKKSLLEILEEWNFSPEQLVAITTDSGSNIKLACWLLRWKRLSCFGHNLDLSISKGLRDDSIEEVLQVCRQVVAKFSPSWKKTRNLAESQKDNLPLYKLKADCTIRWGSSYDMISRIIEQQKATCVVLASDCKCINLLSLLHFESIDSMISVLKPLRELTDILNAFVIKCWLPMTKIQTWLRI